MFFPEEWTVVGKILIQQELYTSGYIAQGETITLKVLKADIIDKHIFHINLIVGYEIINNIEVYEYPNLPLNIET